MHLYFMDLMDSFLNSQQIQYEGSFVDALLLSPILLVEIFSTLLVCRLLLSLKVLLVLLNGEEQEGVGTLGDDPNNSHSSGAHCSICLHRLRAGL